MSVHVAAHKHASAPRSSLFVLSRAKSLLAFASGPLSQFFWISVSTLPGWTATTSTGTVPGGYVASLR